MEGLLLQIRVASSGEVYLCLGPPCVQMSPEAFRRLVAAVTRAGKHLDAGVHCAVIEGAPESN